MESAPHHRAGEHDDAHRQWTRDGGADRRRCEDVSQERIDRSRERGDWEDQYSESLVEEIMKRFFGNQKCAALESGAQAWKPAPRLVAMLAMGVVAFGSDWLTDGKNSQRTNWQEDEKIFTTANVKDTKLLWKIKLDNE